MHILLSDSLRQLKPTNWQNDQESFVSHGISVKSPEGKLLLESTKVDLPMATKDAHELIGPTTSAGETKETTA